MSDDQKNIISELRHERYYNLEPLVYGVQHGGVRLVDLVEVPPDKYLDKYIAHVTGLINMYPVSCSQLMQM